MLKSFRVFRAFRPLRLVSRLPGVRKMAKALTFSIPDCINVSIIFLLIHFVFATFLVNNLKGQLRSCQGDIFDHVVSKNSTYLDFLTHPPLWRDASPSQRSLFSPSSEVIMQMQQGRAVCSVGSSSWPEVPCCVSEGASRAIVDALSATSRLACECWGGSWLPYADRRYDNLVQAMFGLFQVATFEGITLQIYAAVDAAGVDMQPIKGNNVGWIYFFVAFLILGCFFAVGNFIGVVKESFRKHSLGAKVFMTDEQVEWSTAMRLIAKLQPRRKRFEPDHIIRAYCFRLLQLESFQNLFFVLIIAQAALLGAQSFGQSDATAKGLLLANTVFGLLFIFEAAIKLLGLGWRCKCHTTPLVAPGTPTHLSINSSLCPPIYLSTHLAASLSATKRIMCSIIHALI